MLRREILWSHLWKHLCRISKFRIIDFGLADFSEYYPQGRVDVGGPTHAVPKKGPLHISLGKFDMLLPLPMSMQQMKALPRVWLSPNAISCCLFTLPSMMVSTPRPSALQCISKSTHVYTASAAMQPESVRANQAETVLLRRCLHWSVSTASSGRTRAMSTMCCGI